MKFLVGFDDSPGAWDAIALTKVLGALTNCEALLADVLTPPEPIPSPARIRPSERLTGDTAAALDQAVAALRGLEVRTRAVAGGSPAHVLHDLAEMEGSELIAIGSPHHGALGRTFLGSVAENLLRGSPVPVAVAPRGYRGERHRSPELIAVAYDGTTEAKLALAHAQALALAAGAAIRILTVLEPPASIPGIVGYTSPPGFDAGELISQALALLDPEIDADGCQLAGPPAATVAQACEDEVDLLFTGSRGYGPLGRVFIGSFAASLICRSPRPVVVVPRDVRRLSGRVDSPSDRRRGRSAEGRPRLRRSGLEGNAGLGDSRGKGGLRCTSG